MHSFSDKWKTQKNESARPGFPFKVRTFETCIRPLCYVHHNTAAASDVTDTLRLLSTYYQFYRFTTPSFLLPSLPLTFPLTHPHPHPLSSMQSRWTNLFLPLFTYVRTYICTSSPFLRQFRYRKRLPCAK